MEPSMLRISIRADEVTSRAEKSYDRKGAFIGAGKETKRIRLEACGENNKMLVAVASPVITSLGNLLKPFTKFKTNPFVVTLKIENDKGESRLVDVNIRSLAKRLHISKNTLKNGFDLEGSILRGLKNTNLSRVLEEYTAHMEEVPGFKFLSTSKGVMETFKVAMKSEQLSGSYISESGHTFFWAKSEGQNNRIYVVLQEALKANKIGEGSNGTVFQSGKNLALKLDRKGKSKAIKEAEVLKSLTQAGEIEGIMLPPYAIFHISRTKSGIEHTGFLSHLLRTSLDKTNYIKRLSNKEIAMGFAQVLNGLDNIHSQKVFHGDIKPGNIGIDQNKRWRLFDFGGAIDMRKTDHKGFLEFDSREKRGMHTSEYCGLRNAITIHNSKTIPEYQEALKERDYLGVALSFLGTTLGERHVSKMFGYEGKHRYITNIRIDQGKFIKKLTDKGYPRDLAQNLYLMIENSVTKGNGEFQPFLTNFKNSLDKFCSS